MAHPYDIVVLADPRFPGGTSTALAEEIVAAAGQGWRMALMPMQSAVLRYPHAFHPALRRAIDAGLIQLVDPGRQIDAGILLAHHPELFRHPPSEPLRVQANLRLLVVHHPPRDATGQANYDATAVATVAAEAMGGEVVWAPVGPAVRTQLKSMGHAAPLLPEDWVNIIDPLPWRTNRRDFRGLGCIVGRHARPHFLKWPATREQVLSVYPEDPRFQIEILGGGEFLATLMEQRIPPSWRVHPFDPDGAPAFLSGIDFFVYYHHPRWVEAFGRTVLEAMAAGCVAVLPASFAALFEDAALYAPPAMASRLVLQLRGDRSTFLRLGEAGRTFVEDRFGPERHRHRLRGILGRPSGTPPTARPRRERRALVVTSNGIGLGHVTRAMAVARHLAPTIEPIIVTMSQALPVVRRMGFSGHYLPFHVYLNVDPAAWNRWLRLDLLELFGLYEPSVVIFDGNMPFGGLVDAIADRPEIWSLWMRRAMWRPHSGAAALARETRFDGVIEPGELAASADRGPTIGHRQRTQTVAPITLVAPHQALRCEEARCELGLPRDARALLVALGGGNNYDYDVVLAELARWLARHPDVAAVALASPIANLELEPPPPIRVARIYPMARYLAAFDAAISAAGYNSFHELLLAGVPTLFVPNEHPMMDDQLARARWAERSGLALCARSSRPYGLARALDDLFDPHRAAELRTGMARLRPADGASEAAALISEMAVITRHLNT